MSQTPRLQVPPGIRQHLSYAKCARAAPRMLVLSGQYWVDEACVAAAHTLEWPVHAVPVQMAGAAGRDHLAGLLQALIDFRPDFVLSVNLSGMDEAGLLAGLFEDLHLPHAVWFVDNPRTIAIGGSAYGGACAAAFSWERAYLPWLRAHGFAHAAWLPLAADPTLFNRTVPADATRPPSFVGNSMTAYAARERAALEARDAGLLTRVEAALDAGRVTRQAFARGLDAWLDTPPADAHDRRHAELYAFVEATRRLRAVWAQTLAEAGVRLHGDAEWAGVVGAAAAQPLPYRAGLAAHYGATAVNLNTTSVQMAGAVNQRVFDVPASGGCLLTDAQTDVALLLGDGACAVYGSTEDAAEQVARLQADLPRRAALAECGRARVLAEDTYAHRLRQLYAHLQAWFA